MAIGLQKSRTADISIFYTYKCNLDNKFEDVYNIKCVCVCVCMPVLTILDVIMVGFTFSHH